MRRFLNPCQMGVWYRVLENCTRKSVRKLVVYKKIYLTSIFYLYPFWSFHWLAFVSLFSSMRRSTEVRKICFVPLAYSIFVIPVIFGADRLDDAVQWVVTALFKSSTLKEHNHYQNWSVNSGLFHWISLRNPLFPDKFKVRSSQLDVDRLSNNAH